MTLIERLEAGKPEEQEALLKEMFAVVSPPLSDWPSQKEHGRWLYRKVLFNDRLDCGAYLDAVMLLVPEGAFPTIDFVTKRVWLRTEGGFDLPNCAAFGFCQTVPLSLAAAILRAKAPA